MGTFERGQSVEAKEDIRLASGNVIHAGARGRVIGTSTDGETVSIQFADYTGGVSVWAHLIAPAQPAASAAPDVGTTDGLHPDEKLGVALFEASVMTMEATEMHKRVDKLEVALSGLLKSLEPSSKWATQSELLEYIEKKHGGDVLQAYWDAAGALAEVLLGGVGQTSE